MKNLIQAVSTLTVMSLLTSQANAAPYDHELRESHHRRLGASPEFKINDPITGVASCYGKEYSYYKSWKCSNTQTCAGEDDDCPSTDPLDTYWEEEKDKINRLVAIIVPSVLGGCLLILCLCACCATYYLSQYAIEWRAKQARMQPKSGPTRTNSPKKLDDSSESDFERSQNALRKRDR